MTLLTDTLERISIILEQRFSPFARSFTPGLSRAEIDSALGDLSHRLPEEVYELYQWSGGQAYREGEVITSLFYGLSFFSLPEAIDAIEALEDPSIEEYSARYIGKSLFPVFGTDKQFLCVALQSDRTESSPLLEVSEIRETTILYSSLTSMMLTFAESFESNVISSDENGYIDYDRAEFWRIYRKYNLNILELALERLRQELTLFQNRPDMKALSCKALEEFRLQVDFLQYFWGGVDANQIPSSLLAPLITATNSGDEVIRKLAEELLEHINYTS